MVIAQLRCALMRRAWPPVGPRHQKHIIAPELPPKPASKPLIWQKPLHPSCPGVFHFRRWSFDGRGFKARLGMCLFVAALLTRGGVSGENPAMSDSFNLGHFQTGYRNVSLQRPPAAGCEIVASFHAEPEAEVPSAKPPTAIFILVPLMPRDFRRYWLSVHGQSLPHWECSPSGFLPPGCHFLCPSPS